MPTRPGVLYAWDSTGTHIIVPTSGHQASGYVDNEVPGSGETNGLYQNWWQELAWLDQRVATWDTSRWYWSAPGVSINASSGATVSRNANLSLAGVTALITVSEVPSLGQGTLVGGAAVYFTGIGHGTGGTSFGATLYIRLGNGGLVTWGMISQTDPPATSTLYALVPSSGMAGYALGAGESLILNCQILNNGASLDSVGVQLAPPAV